MAIVQKQVSLNGNTYYLTYSNSGYVITDGVDRFVKALDDELITYTETDTLVNNLPSTATGTSTSTSDVYDPTSESAMSGKAVAEAISGKADSAALPTFLSDLIDNLGSSPIHTHSQYLTSVTAHTHDSADINTMTGYTKPSSASAITTFDSLNTAIGKLEKSIEGKTSNVGTVVSVNNISPDANGNVTVPTNGTVDQAYDSTSSNPQSGVAINGAGFLRNMGSITSATDTFNLTPGIYAISGATNAGLPDPSQPFYGVLIQYGGTHKPQLLVAGTSLISGLYHRRYLTSNSDWSGWIRCGNSAAGLYALTLGGNPSIHACATNVGIDSQATNTAATSYGHCASAGADHSIAIGMLATVSSSANQAIQLGYGTNSTPSTLQIGFSGTNYLLLDGTNGLIPYSRISAPLQSVTLLEDGDVLLSNGCAIYKHEPSEPTTYDFQTTNLSLSSSVAYTFELCIVMSTVYRLTFPNNVYWLDNTIPDFSSTGTYFLVFRSIDGGTSWIGNLQGKWSMSVSVGCVLGNTLVTMGDGSIKEVKELNNGDLVLSYNKELNIFEPQQVKSLQKVVKSDIIRVVFEDDTFVELTSGHPILTNEGWASYDNSKTNINAMHGEDLHQLKVGSLCKSFEGVLKSVKEIEVYETSETDVYGFDVSNNYNFVGNGIVLHNGPVTGSAEK